MEKVHRLKINNSKCSSDIQRKVNIYIPDKTLKNTYEKIRE